MDKVELAGELAILVTASDADIRRHGFVGAWADLPLKNWLWDNRRAILHALRTEPSTASLIERMEGEYERGLRDAANVVEATIPKPAGGPFSHTNSMRVVLIDAVRAIRTKADAGDRNDGLCRELRTALQEPAR